MSWWLMNAKLPCSEGKLILININFRLIVNGTALVNFRITFWTFVILLKCTSYSCKVILQKAITNEIYSVEVWIRQRSKEKGYSFFLAERKDTVSFIIGYINFEKLHLFILRKSHILSFSVITLLRFTF